MRSERDIIELIARALRDKEIAREREAARLADETEAKRVFFQAARAVFTHVVMPEMERFGRVIAQARVRAAISDSGAFYLPGQTDPNLVAKFALPLNKPDPALPLCVSFKAVFPAGMAVYFTDVDKSQIDAKGAVDMVPLEDLDAGAVQDHLVRVLENYLHEC